MVVAVAIAVAVVVILVLSLSSCCRRHPCVVFVVVLPSSSLCCLCRRVAVVIGRWFSHWCRYPNGFLSFSPSLFVTLDFFQSVSSSALPCVVVVVVTIVVIFFIIVVIIIIVVLSLSSFRLHRWHGVLSLVQVNQWFFFSLFVCNP